MVLWVLALACGHREPDPPSPAELVARRIDEEVAARYPGLALEISEEGLIVARSGTRSTPLPLEELTIACELEPDRCAARVTSVVELAAVSVGPHLGRVTAADVAALRPTLRSPANLAELRGRLSEAGADPDTLVVAPFVGELSWVPVLDRPETQQVVLAEHLGALGVDAATALTTAVANLAGAVTVEALPADEVAPGVRMVYSDDGYGAARLALPAAWAPLAEGLDGALVATAVSRDLVLVAPASDATGLHAVKRVAEAAGAADVLGVGWYPLAWSPDGWAAFP